ncbi:MAG: HAMP domain-containing sensor histidine kinase, partial [Acidimicrobiia bacterium]|nr:HAMP domain-containing sensor histidine kinase [Acidimicrobiia bacterium]
MSATRIDPRGTGFRAALVATAMVALAGALVFANASASRNTARDGLIAQQAEAVVGASELALKATGQAVLLAEDRDFGVATDETVGLAVAEGLSILDELVALANSLNGSVSVAGGAPISTTSVQEFGADVLTGVTSGQTAEAGERLATDFLPALEGLRSEASAIRDSHLALLEASGDLASLLSTAALFIVVLLVPLGAFAVYRWAIRRQLAVVEAQMDARLEAEHKITMAKDEFIANMSHELKTPLTSIYGFSEVLIDTGLVDPSMTMDLVSMINTESAELGRMVEDLLVTARLATDSLVLSQTEVDIGDTVTTIVAPMTRAGTTVEMRVSDGAVIADADAVRQVIRNLLSNAVRHGGPTIQVTGRPDVDTYLLVVEDDGDGVPADKEGGLFRRYVHEGN